MKFLFFVMFVNLAYAQETSKQPPKETELQKQEAPSTSIPNPFEVGPYKADEYIYFDRLKNEREEKKKEQQGL